MIYRFFYKAILVFVTASAPCIKECDEKDFFSNQMLLTCLLASGSLMILSQLFCLNNSFHITLTLFLPHEGAKVKRGTVLTELQMDEYMWNVQLKGLNYIKC